MDFYIMSKDVAVAKWQNNNLEVINEKMLPLYLKNTGNVEKWLEKRAIDCHRANSRLLKKALRLAEKDDVSTVLSVNASTITDNYWIKPLNSDLTYADVRFDNDYFANLALTGELKEDEDILKGFTSLFTTKGYFPKATIFTDNSKQPKGKGWEKGK